MSALLQGYGRVLTVFFFLAVTLWATALIVLPQAAILESSLRKPDRQLDSGVADALARDAATCALILTRSKDSAGSAPSLGGGVAIPSISGPSAAPSPSPSLGVPSIGGASAGGVPRVIQCDRATTRTRLVRGPGDPAEFLNEVYALETLAVDPDADLETQIAQAEAVQAAAAAAAERIRAIEASASPYGFDNFESLFAARQIPLSDAAKAEERASVVNQLQRLFGLRFEQDGEVYVRLGLTTLVTTLAYAAIATALALAICYPIAYNLALTSGPAKAAWLFLALLVPYAIVELMRVYAWLSIIENRGLINGVLSYIGVVDPNDPIQFKRSPITVFVVIVYTYILFMMFPLVNVLSTLDRSQVEAARDLGGSTIRIHRRVVIPHAKPGIAVGCIATFMLAAGAFSVPRIISRGLQGQWYAQTIYDKFFESGAVNAGAAYAFAFTAVCFVLIALFMWVMRARLTDFVRV